MQKIIFTISLILLVKLNTYAQVSDSTIIKKGWNFGALPALGYDSNLGFLYGGIVNLYDYGAGDHYPDFTQNVYIQLSAYTKGSMDAILSLDSYSLFPDKHFTARLSYNRNRAYPFYGFNGRKTVYNTDFVDEDKTDFITQVFYNMDRDLIKADLILQDNFGNSDFNWLVGLDFGSYKTSRVDFNHLNKGKDEEDLIVDKPTLYDRYIEWGIIEEKEKEGGLDNSLKFGLVYDTRDHLTNPMKGCWTELITRVTPGFLGNYDSFIRLSLIHRQYFTLVKDKLSFAYRLWYEGAFGKVPFYSTSYLTASNYREGMGGSTTLRGVLMNRLVGKQTAIGNLELRWKTIRFNAIKQNFYLGCNAFMDGGYIIQGYDMDLSTVPDLDRDIYFKDHYKELVTSGGLGLKLVMNENFVVSVDYGLSFDKNYGTSGLYVGIDYLF